MTIYNGGSKEDEKLGSITYNFDCLWKNTLPCLLTPIESSGNQIFIEFTSDGYGTKKNFSASISFGIDYINLTKSLWRVLETTFFVLLSCLLPIQQIECMKVGYRMSDIVCQIIQS